MALTAVEQWSTTAASNTTLGASITLDGTVMAPSQVDDGFRELMAQIATQFGKANYKGADIASASTTDLSAATGNYVHITGTTSITALGTVAAGQVYILEFDAALTLTHNATSLILPDAANIKTQAGAIAIMVSEGAGNWRCVNYQQAALSGIQSGTQVATTSGTSIDFTGIPPWVKRITVLFSGVSTSGTSIPILRLGASGGIEATGYLTGVGDILGSTAAAAALTSGFSLDSSSAASTRHGKIVLDLMNAATFTWIGTGEVWNNQASVISYLAGSKSTASALDRVRLTTVNGTDTFDAGTINITWE